MVEGFTRWWDAVASTTTTPSERAVLAALARRADWSNGGSAYPSVKTIAADAGLSERAAQYALRSLACDAPCGRRRCHHRGLIEAVAGADRYQPVTYRMLLTLPQQGRLDELAARRRPDPYAHLHQDGGAALDAVQTANRRSYDRMARAD